MIAVVHPSRSVGYRTFVLGHLAQMDAGRRPQRPPITSNANQLTRSRNALRVQGDERQISGKGHPAMKINSKSVRSITGTARVERHDKATFNGRQSTDVTILRFDDMELWLTDAQRRKLIDALAVV